MSQIRVAVVGIGGCASALIQGVQYYKNNPTAPGLMYYDIGGYSASDITFVAGWDVDARKVNRPLSEAIYEKPNCSMLICDDVRGVTCWGLRGQVAMVRRGPTLDGIAPHMRELHDDLTFGESDAPEDSFHDVVRILKQVEADVLINCLPVGSHEGSRFYIEAAIAAGVHVVNCIPTYIETSEAMELEQKFIDAGLTFIGSDMRSGFGASRLSEVLQGSMLDAGLTVTSHLQLNMSAGSTQGQEHIATGRSSSTDFGNMAVKERLKSKHISKENVIRGQSKLRNDPLLGKTMFAGPSLTAYQVGARDKSLPSGILIASDNKVANLDIVAYGFGGARYELTCRLSVQDSPNSGAVVVSAIRFCKVASELGIIGTLRGASAWTQKSPPCQTRTEDAKFECDALARRMITPMTEKQLKSMNPVASKLPYGFNDSDKD